MKTYLSTLHNLPSLLIRRTMSTNTKYCSIKLNSAFDGYGLMIPSIYKNIPRPNEQSLEKLDELIGKNNSENATLFNNQNFHNHMPHALISYYFLGADSKHLQKLYDETKDHYNRWLESPGEITEANWTEHLGDVKYETAYHEFFKKELANLGNDWRKLVQKFCSNDGSNSLLNGLVAGLLHPLIHLGYAAEVESGLLACEALTLAAAQYVNYLPYIEGGESIPKTDSIQEVLEEIQQDEELNGLLQKPRTMTTAKLLSLKPEKMKYYANRLYISDNPAAQIPELMLATATLFGASHQDDDKQYDFFLLHTLTSMHAAAEILLVNSILPKELHKSLVRQLWTVWVCVYTVQMRPKVDINRILLKELPNGSAEDAWEKAIDLALNGPMASDEHLVKAIRALLFAECYTNDDKGYFARIAVDFAENFTKNGGYVGGSSDKHTLDITP